MIGFKKLEIEFKSEIEAFDFKSSRCWPPSESVSVHMGLRPRARNAVRGIARSSIYTAFHNNVPKNGWAA